MDVSTRRQTVEEFLEWLYTTYRFFLLKSIRGYVDDTNICEDVFQDVFVKIIKNVDLLYEFPVPKVEAYITLVARGVSIDYIRKNFRDKHNNDNLIIARGIHREEYINTSHSSTEKVDLSLMLSDLPSEDQILLIGKYYIGLSINDLVELVGGTPTAIRSKLHRAKRRVFNEWRRSGLNMGDFIDE